jgi:superfamily II DNA or RNA helicase
MQDLDLFKPPIPLSLPGGMIPFPFQRQVVEEFFRHVNAGDRRILLCAGTGAGKTFMSAMIVYSMGGRCVFLVDLNCLIEQAIAEFEQLGLRAVSYQGSVSKSAHNRLRMQFADVIVASCQTLESRRKKQGLQEILGEVDLVIADECHTTAFSRAYSALRNTYKQATFLGLSATIKTQSPGDRYLGRFFDVVIRSPSMPEMIRINRCVPARMFSPSGVISVSTLHTDFSGDYDLDEQQDQIEAKYPDIVRSWIELGENRSTVAYCPTVASAEGLAVEFRLQGIRTEVQTGSTPMGLDGLKEHIEGVVTRASQGYRLDTGVTKVVCSVGTQVKGWNLQSLGCVMLVRATKSLALFLQITGRGSRACSNPYWCEGVKENYILLDFGDNLQSFHPISPNDFGSRDSDYDIAERSPTREPKERTLSDKQETKPKKEEEDLDGDATPDFAMYEWLDMAAVKQIDLLRKAKKDAYKRSLSPDTAERAFLQEYGFIPHREWHEGAVFGAFPTRQNRADYQEYLKRFAPNDYWLQVNMNLEFGSGKAKSKVQAKQPWYRVLGVSPKTTLAIAYRAYQKLTKQYSSNGEAIVVLSKAWEEAQKVLS